MRYDIYVHVELNLIPIVVTLILIIIKIFLFDMANEICNIETKLRLTTVFYTSLFYIVPLYFLFKNSIDKFEAATTFYCAYCSM